MNYREALDWLYGFSDSERTGHFVHDREDNLRRERTLLAALGNPHRAYGVTHVAGTKGKGSTSAMIASMLRAGGLRVGLYTQPDLHTFRERMQINGVPISEEDVVCLVPELRDALTAIGQAVGSYITYEIATALAFLYFQRAGAQHAVVEVGLGGRLDATNVVKPIVAVITSISYDHMQVLGNTLSAIATEKAGIIKPGVPTVCSAQAPEAQAVIARVAAERHARLLTVGPSGSGAVYTYRAGHFNDQSQWFTVSGPDEDYQDLELGLLGEHQIENATAAIAAIETLRASGVAIDEQAMRTGLRQVRWPARLQVAGEKPLLVVDGAHNADSLARLLAALQRHFVYGRLVLVLGMMADKDLAGMAEVLGSARLDSIVATAASNKRSLPPEEIARAMALVALDVRTLVAPTIPEALTTALALAGADDCICVTGSLYVAAEALRWFAAHGGARVMHPINIDGVDH